MSNQTDDLTEMLLAWGERKPGAEDSLFPLVYGELKRIARRHLERERGGTPCSRPHSCMKPTCAWWIRRV